MNLIAVSQLLREMNGAVTLYEEQIKDSYDKGSMYRTGIYWFMA